MMLTQYELITTPNGQTMNIELAEFLPSIDWAFISELEGHRVLHGYVPTHDSDNNDKSGVTIATGFDLGQRNIHDLKRLEIPDELCKKLYPYLLVKDEDAWALLKRIPLTITEDEAALIDRQTKKRVTMRLAMFWRKFAQSDFVSLPAEVQTVLFSLAWNFGEALHITLPTIWGICLRAAKDNNWQPLADQLANFKGAAMLRERRIKEGMYLRPLLSDGENASDCTKGVV